MNWYIAKIVFSITTESITMTPQFDEQLRLINAKNSEEALIKARIIGENEDEQFMNDKNKTVRWKFIDVAELQPLNEIKDGMEVYSHTYEPEAEDAHSYISFVQQKAAFLATQSMSYSY